MKAFLASSFALLLGCSAGDPIGRIVAEESRNPYFGNGLVNRIRLPASATSTQVVSEVFRSMQVPAGPNFTILQVRQVRIPCGDKSPDSSDSDYTAVLADTISGRKVVLLQFQRYGKDHTNWWSRVYDAP